MPYDPARALHARFRCGLDNFYGTTECHLVSWTGVDSPWSAAALSAGKPVPGAEVRIVDPGRKPLPQGKTGEIAVRSTQMMAGYYRDAGRTAAVLDAEGWFYTGDAGFIDEDRRLRLTGRLRDFIVRGGENVYPGEVEQYLERHPAVRRAAVVGAPSAYIGESVCAFLELQRGSTLTVQDVHAFCRGKIAPHKIPDDVRFLDRLPVTATGKVQKYRLRRSLTGGESADVWG